MSAQPKHIEQAAESCAVCPHAHDGAVIEGIGYPRGWHCDANEVAGTRGKERERVRLCALDYLWGD